MVVGNFIADEFRGDCLVLDLEDALLEEAVSLNKAKMGSAGLCCTLVSL